MQIEKIENHVEIANSRLVQQDKESYKLISFQSALVSKIQELEDAGFDVLNNSGVFTAYGKTLDLIGEIVGEKRDYRNDTFYRTAILSRIAINNSCGTANEIISILSLYFKRSEIRVFDIYPADFVIFIGANFDLEKFKTLVSLVKLIKPAGVNFYTFIVYPLDTGIITFIEETLNIYDYNVSSVDIINLIVNTNNDILAVISNFENPKYSESIGFAEQNDDGTVIGGGLFAEEFD